MRTVLKYCLLLSWFASSAQLPVKINFSKDKDIQQTKNFRLQLVTNGETITAFNSETEELKRTYDLELPNQGTILASFEYTSDNETWEKVEYPILMDQGLKRIEIVLSFSVNKSSIEYLQEFTVDKYFSAEDVTIEPVFKKEIGSQPVFMLINNSGSIYWGNSSSNHFYGRISRRIDFEQKTYGWIDQPFSYCLSTIPEQPLERLDTAFSWVPSYFASDEFKIKAPGTYKYIVALGLDKSKSSIPSNLVNSGTPQIQTRKFFELETQFEIN